MAKLFFTILFVIVSYIAEAQNVGIGTTSPNPVAMLDVSSSSKGVLMPRVSTTGRSTIISPPKGLMVYDTTASAFYYYDGGRWLPFYQQNFDSATIDYSNTAGSTYNLPTTAGSIFSIPTNENSGIIYDNGGAAGNYLANSNSSVLVSKDDSTVAIKLIIEEMNAELFYDSLFFIQYNINTNGYTDTIGRFTSTQTGTVNAVNSVKMLFKSNNINHLAGFKIRWGRIRIAAPIQTSPPLYGWHFDTKKIAAAGGLPINNSWHTDSLGYGSFSYGVNNRTKGIFSKAMGYFNNASGNYSTAFGNLTKASGISSTAMGYNTTSSGDFSTALGAATVASGDYSTALGQSTIASSSQSTAMGYITLASGFRSTAMGSSATASGNYSTAMGYSTTASGINSTAMGDVTEASGINSTAMGSSTTASGLASTAMGYLTTARAYGSLVIGRYNDSVATSSTTSWIATDPVFIIGNGTSNFSLSNALVVLKNGNVAIGDNNTPVNKLQVTGTINNVSLLDNSGMMTIGYTSSTNMVVDQNDIQVRSSGAASDMYLQRLGGNVGIGNTGTPAYQLELSTNSAGKPGSGTWTIASDRRLKENIRPFTEGLQQLIRINPVRYHYNQQSGYDTKPEYIGIIAQELQQVAPYMVSSVKKNGSDYLNVDNGAMTYMLINAVKEQQKIIDDLKKRIEVLEKK